MDLSNPDTGDSGSLSGYIVDPDNSDKSDPVESISQALGLKRIELAKISLNNDGKGYNSVVSSQSSPGVALWKSGKTATDHNGFFFFATEDDSGSVGVQLGGIKSGLYSAPNWNSYNYLDSSSFPPIVSVGALNGAAIGVYVNLDNNITDYSRTRISFGIKATDGLGVDNVYGVLTGGETKQSDALGSIEFIAYADTLSGGRQRSGDILNYPESSACSVSFNPTLLSFGEVIGNGFKTNSDTLILPDVTAVFSLQSNKSFLKRGGAYEYGLVYFDRANRSGSTNVKSTEVLIPFYTEEYNGVIPSETQPILGWQIKHLPPEWATHYQWVRTKNTATNRYIQWCPDTVSYLDESGTASDFTSGSQVALDVTNITGSYLTAHPDSLLSYDYTPGDRVRFIKDENGAFYDEYLDVKITGFLAGIITFEKLNSFPEFKEGVLVEIYTPKLDAETDIFYEIGECFEVKTVVSAGVTPLKYHAGLLTDQNPFFPDIQPATGIFQTGDTYYRARDIQIDSGSRSNVIDSQNFSDFWDSRVSDIGRPNRVDLDAERVNRPTTVYYSEKFAPETNINGLNSFYDDSFESYDRSYGSIKKLYSHDKRLDCFQETKTSKILVEENVTYDQFDQGNVATSDKVLSNAIYYTLDYGTLNPESFTEHAGRRYFVDIRRGAVLRLGNDGLTAISENLMSSYFEDKSNFYSSFDLIPEIWGVYDVDHDEYIVSFGSVSRPEGFTPDELDLVSSQAEVVTEVRNGLEYTFILGYSENEDGIPTEFEIVRDVANGVYIINSSAGSIDMDRQKILTIPGETLGFSETTKYWTSFYSYIPECFCKVGIDFLSFKNGRAYLHNSNNLRNNFYGVGYPSEVWSVFNQSPSEIKVFNSIGVESDTIWYAREILTQNGQASKLDVEDFQDDQGQGLVFDSKETIHFSDFWQDINTENVDFPLFEGDDLRDKSLLVKLTNDSSNRERLFAANVNVSLSRRGANK